MYQLHCLIANGLDDARVCVAEGVNAESGNEIEVALAVDVKEKDAFAPAQHDGVSVVGLQQKLPLAFGDLFKVIHRKFQFYRITEGQEFRRIQFVISDTHRCDIKRPGLAKRQESPPARRNELPPRTPSCTSHPTRLDPMIQIAHVRKRHACVRLFIATIGCKRKTSTELQVKACLLNDAVAFATK